MDGFSFGRGDRALVILPGLSVQSVMLWADAVAEAYRPLAEDFTVCVLDRRKELPAAYSVRGMAEDTAAAIRALGLERVCLFGASQGGMIAMMIAAEHPELVSRLVLGSTAARVDAARFRAVEAWIRLARAGDAQGLYLAFGEAVYPPEVFAQSREELTAAAAAVTDEELRRFVILAESMRGFDAAARLPELACPVLVLGDRDDRVFGADASEEIAALLAGHPGCALYLYEGFGHAAYDTAPDYKERMLRFLTAE